MRKFISYGPALVVLTTVLVVLVAGPAAVYRLRAAETHARILLAQRTLDDDDLLERLNRSVRAVAEAVRPSVVHIEVAGGQGRASGHATGSGWVFDESHVITNAHVVRGAESISVEFSDGRTVRAQAVRGRGFLADPYTDIAVLRIPSDVAAFPIKRATGVQPQQGDRVFAFGSPFGFKFSMSEGIVSGLARDPMAAVQFGGFTNFIQTDAAVNPGNSGGPLVDIKGRLIGMNVAIATGRETQGTTEGQSAGISFAIPLGTIESVVSQLIETGRVSRGYLGISWPQGQEPVVYDPATRRMGVRVLATAEDGPARKAGIRPGDVITAVDGQPVTAMETLRALITSLRPGQTVRLEGFRSGSPITFDVVLGEYPRDALAQNAAVGEFFRYGLRLRDTAKGPAVRSVIPDSAADKAGFRESQLILRVDDKPVSDVREVLTIAAEAGLLIGARVDFTVAEDNESVSTPREIVVRILR
jgi:S1-C subfamily serine protease